MGKSFVGDFRITGTDSWHVTTASILADKTFLAYTNNGTLDKEIHQMRKDNKWVLSEQIWKHQVFILHVCLFVFELLSK